MSKVSSVNLKRLYSYAKLPQCNIMKDSTEKGLRSNVESITSYDLRVFRSSEMHKLYDYRQYEQKYAEI